MSKMPWVRFFHSDWLAGTRGLTAVETGVYVTLIATMYERDGPIVADIPRLARLCGASNSAFKKALDCLIDAGKLSRVDGMLTNTRVEKELRFQFEKSEVAAQNAKSRWASENGKSQQKQSMKNADAMLASCENDANQISEAIVQKEDQKEKKTRESALSAPFEALLIESGVEPETLKAWKAVRAAKRAGPITAPVTAALARETAKAGISQQQAITICCERGWQGFKADWLNETRTHSPPRATAPPKRTLATMWLDDNEGFFTNGADSEIHGQGDTAGNPESDAWPLVIASTDSRRN